MKRTIPLFITAAVGFVLIVAFFSPYTENWGEATMIWFDILAAIAMILGGGNLLKIHLKKISDRPPGWGYSVVTLAAFLATLFVGLSKWGVPPAAKQEHYGESFAHLPLAAFPETFSVEGRLPRDARGKPKKLPASVRRQLVETTGGRLRFTGWMTPDQKKDLTDLKEELRWRCTVERLYALAQPPERFRGRLKYYVDHQMLSFKGAMDEADNHALRRMGQTGKSSDPAQLNGGEQWESRQQAAGRMWTRAVNVLEAAAHRMTDVGLDDSPPGFTDEKAKKISKSITFHKGRFLGIQGPMSVEERNALAAQFPVARPLSPQRRRVLIGKLESGGRLSRAQIAALDKVLDKTWTVPQLHKALDHAGKAEQVDKTFCEMFAEQKAGVGAIEPKKWVGKDQTLGDRQVRLLAAFAENEQMTVDALVEQLRRAGPFSAGQESALKDFLRNNPTEPQRRYELFRELVRADPSHPLSKAQKDYLLKDYRREVRWREKVGRLFVEAHTVKFPWSGEYNALGAPFWWMYEYAFKPLTATMFAMLAFYVASAAFRAFRAKNVEAALLLGTAFIILLGQTYAGYVATAWLPNERLPEWMPLGLRVFLSWLRIENLSLTIMSVFNTAGNRAIMIGIALGIASTSLRVLLGIDRSYLGSGEE